MQKIRIIGFFFENTLHRQFSVQMLPFTACTCVWTFRPRLIRSTRSHNTVLWIFLWVHLKITVHESNPHTIQALKVNTSHSAAATKITALHRLYLNMATARLFTNCSDTLRNMQYILTPVRISQVQSKKGGRATFRDPPCITQRNSTQTRKCYTDPSPEPCASCSSELVLYRAFFFSVRVVF